MAKRSTKSATKGIPTQDERNWAMLAHLSILLNLVSGFLGIIAVLIIYFSYQTRSKYVANQALQSFVFQLITWVGGGILIGSIWLVTGVLSAFLIGIVCIPAACAFSTLPILAVGYGVVGAIECSRGEAFEYIWIGNWLRGNGESAEN